MPSGIKHLMIIKNLYLKLTVIFNPVVQMAALKQPVYYARFPALSLG